MKFLLGIIALGLLGAESAIIYPNQINGPNNIVYYGSGNKISGVDNTVGGYNNTIDGK